MRNLTNMNYEIQLKDQPTVRLHLQQALMAHLEVMEDKQHHYTAANFAVLYVDGAP